MNIVIKKSALWQAYEVKHSPVSTPPPLPQADSKIKQKRNKNRGTIQSIFPSPEKIKMSGLWHQLLPEVQAHDSFITFLKLPLLSQTLETSGWKICFPRGRASDPGVSTDSHNLWHPSTGSDKLPSATSRRIPLCQKHIRVYLELVHLFLSFPADRERGERGHCHWKRSIKGGEERLHSVKEKSRKS